MTMEKIRYETPDNVLYPEDVSKIGQSIDSHYWKKTVFDAIKNSCKRSRQNVKQLGKDLFLALTGKRKKNSKK